MFAVNQGAILIVSLIGTLIYGAYVVIDLHLVATQVSIDDYILGAMMLYIDLLRIFIFILRIVGRRK
jgi:FtsH-binding integral membrane protein